MAEKNSGAKLYIGGNTLALASETTWVEIKGVKGITGAPGLTWKTVDTSDLSDIVDKVSKTTVDAGTLTVVYNEIDADAGQEDLVAAAADGDSDLAYNFKLVNATADKIMRFKAHVLTDTLGGFNRQNVREKSTQLKLQTIPTVAST